MRAALLLSAAAVVSACASAPPPPAGHGQPPTDAQAVVAAYLAGAMRDPASVQLAWIKGPGRVSLGGGLLQREAAGWGICFSANAKNGFGAYTGFRTIALLYRDGALLRTYGEDARSQFEADKVREVCGQV